MFEFAAEGIRFCLESGTGLVLATTNRGGSSESDIPASRLELVDVSGTRHALPVVALSWTHDPSAQSAVIETRCEFRQVSKALALTVTVVQELFAYSAFSRVEICLHNSNAALHPGGIWVILLQNHGPLGSVCAEQPLFNCDSIPAHDNKDALTTIWSHTCSCAAAWWRCLCMLSVTREAAWLQHRFPETTRKVYNHVNTAFAIPHMDCSELLRQTLQSIAGQASYSGTIEVKVVTREPVLDVQDSQCLLSGDEIPVGRFSEHLATCEDYCLTGMVNSPAEFSLRLKYLARSTVGILDLLRYFTLYIIARGTGMCMGLDRAISDSWYHLIRCGR